MSTDNDSDGRIRVRITDSGMGIEPALLPRLFAPFEQGGQQINGQYGGLGLGLSICRSMAEAHGGTVTAESEGGGKGATFTVLLPLSTAPVVAQTLRLPARRAAASVATSRRILLVEDHADTARMLSRLLRAKGNAVETAGDVASALELAKRSGFDLLISDLGLPDGSGHDLMRQLVARGQPIKAIALSGYGTDDDIRTSREVGFAEHLVKPIDVSRLMAAIERVANLR